MLIRVKANKKNMLISLFIVILSDLYLTNLTNQIESNTPFKIFDMRIYYKLKDVEVGLKSLSEWTIEKYSLFLAVDLLVFITSVLVMQLLLHNIINKKLQLKIWYIIANTIVVVKALADSCENICALGLIKGGYNVLIANILVICSRLKMLSTLLWISALVFALAGLCIKHLKTTKKDAIPSK